MSLVKNIVASAKKHVIAGLIGQVLVTIAAGIAFFVESILLIVWMVPVGKYGPPPTPTPLVPVSTPGPGIADTLITLIVILCSLLLYAWAVLGWAFWGAILYFRMSDKKQ